MPEFATMDGIPENVARQRHERRWSQQELARRANVNKETVNRLENGHGFTDKTLVAIARALHTTPARLRGEVEAKEPSPELERLLFLFARLSVKGRLALLATAEALLEMQQVGSAPPSIG
jgi:transcriptional regulator with XRE-family HTH domain